MHDAEWKVYPADERYEVSAGGQVRMIGGAIRKTKRAAKMRYHALNFVVGKRIVTRYVHEMVLTTFAGPRPAGLQGSHLDGDVNNNAASNLAWETRAANLARRKCNKLTEQDVIAIRSGADIKEVAERVGVRVDSLYKVRRGERWKCVPLAA